MKIISAIIHFFKNRITRPIKNKYRSLQEKYQELLKNIQKNVERTELRNELKTIKGVENGKFLIVQMSYNSDNINHELEMLKLAKDMSLYCNYPTLKISRFITCLYGKAAPNRISLGTFKALFIDEAKEGN